MPLCLWYVNCTFTIREKFTGTSGLSISEKILEKIKELKLEMLLCRGQGYDGAGNMSGKYVGVSTLILKKYPLTIYTVHCICHRLNLCLANSCTLQIFKNMIGTLQKAILYFDNSAKRIAKPIEIVKKVLSEKHSELNMIMLCLTRWIEKIDSMHRFHEVLSLSLKHLTLLRPIPENVERRRLC